MFPTLAPPSPYWPLPPHTGLSLPILAPPSSISDKLIGICTNIQFDLDRYL